MSARRKSVHVVTVSEGTNTVVGIDPARIVETATAVLEGRGKSGRVPERWDGLASERIAEVLRSR